VAGDKEGQRLKVKENIEHSTFNAEHRSRNGSRGFFHLCSAI